MIFSDSDHILKIVHFHEYCPTCKYKDLKDHSEPCNECLDHPGNYNSHKPVKYEKKEEK